MHWPDIDLWFFQIPGKRLPLNCQPFLCFFQCTPNCRSHIILIQQDKYWLSQLMGGWLCLLVSQTCKKKESGITRSKHFNYLPFCLLTAAFTTTSTALLVVILQFPSQSSPSSNEQPNQGRLNNYKKSKCWCNKNYQSSHALRTHFSAVR